MTALFDTHIAYVVGMIKYTETRGADNTRIRDVILKAKSLRLDIHNGILHLTHIRKKCNVPLRQSDQVRVLHKRLVDLYARYGHMFKSYGSQSTRTGTTNPPNKSCCGWFKC